MERYDVRPRDNGGFGIFDRAVNGWTGPAGHTRAEAEQIAEKLEVLHQRTLDARKESTGQRRVDPPQPVRVHITLTVDAVLYRWARSEGGWSGEVELKPDRRYWVKAADLEQVTPDA